MKKEKANGQLSSHLLKAASDDSEQTLSMDWLATHRDSKKVKLNDQAQVHAFKSTIWPNGESYFSPVPSIFILEILNLETLNSQPGWIIRDGVVPLLWFFKTFPRPGKLKSKIYLNSSLLKFVPTAWQPFVGSYRTVSTQPFNSNKSAPNKLIVCATIGENHCSLKGLETRLEKWVSSHPEIDIQKMEKQIFFPIRMSPSNTDAIYPIKFMIEFCRYFGPENNQVLTWPQVQMSHSWEGFYFLEINDHLICSDSSLKHDVLSKGGINFEQSSADQTIDPKSEFISLSPYHGFEISDEAKFDKSISTSLKRSIKEHAEFNELYLKTIQSEANQNLPWPSWFSMLAEEANII